jgi:hypothetical protein
MKQPLQGEFMSRRTWTAFVVCNRLRQSLRPRDDWQILRTPAIPDEQIKGGFYMKTRISAVRMEDMENEAA